MQNNHPPELTYNFDPTQIGCTLIIGQSRAGKISHFENDPNYKIIELSEEEENQIKEKMMLAKIAREQRFNAIKEAYWNNTDPSDYIIEFLTSTLVASTDLFNDTPPSLDQIKSFFMLFDEYSIGQLISFPLPDTETEKAIYDFINENIQEITSKIKQLAYGTN
ncbi:hypothetical protein N5J44_16370 [Acinetobacter ursingii]|uniref:hypothetical protein n=1 Tax=Acinetobacter ursingii TaxID=108980 RepID=UPI00244D4E29|nr:hypothetical protein [Acinetobacter ursingii]MDH2020752.1 hypothetical protein [Acinetobacter ursingii]MDH2073081.1 hypothetical protein [Acinetobacter ursingii]